MPGSEIILNAFIARRQLLRESGEFAGVRVIGSRYSKETHRVRDFLGRNRVLFTFLDLEGDPEVAARSVKRLASAVGEGAMAVQFVHAYPREM